MLNKQGPGTMIDWTDWSWNPISGCLHGCSYCYLKAMGQRFKKDMMTPKFHPDHFEKFQRIRKVKPGDKIFVGSSGDMWGEWVEEDWIKCVLCSAEDNLDFIFQFLTKNPSKYMEFDLYNRLNCWFGTTVDGTKKTEDNIHSLMWSTGSYCRITRFVSFEPLLKPVDPDLFGIQWIIVGADSTKGAVKPPKEWADHLIKKARLNNIPVWVKDNYGYPEVIKEFPKTEQ